MLDEACQILVVGIEYGSCKREILNLVVSELKPIASVQQIKISDLLGMSKRTNMNINGLFQILGKV